MSVGYILVNQTKKEQITYIHIPATTKHEIVSCSISAAITTWYLLENAGDCIAFISDTYGEWPFNSGAWEDIFNYREVTDEVVEKLITAKILRDEGKEVFDECDPTSYMRKLRLV